MSSTANQSAKTIWLIEHDSDNIWLLELILDNWGYDAVRMKDREALEPQIDSQPTLPSLPWLASPRHEVLDDVEIPLTSNVAVA